MDRGPKRSAQSGLAGRLHVLAAYALLLLTVALALLASRPAETPRTSRPAGLAAAHTTSARAVCAVAPVPRRPSHESPSRALDGRISDPTPLIASPTTLPRGPARTPSEREPRPDSTALGRKPEGAVSTPFSSRGSRAALIPSNGSGVALRL